MHVKTLLAQELRALLTARKLLVEKLRDVDNSLRGILRGFGLSSPLIFGCQVAAHVHELRTGREQSPQPVATEVFDRNFLVPAHADALRQAVRVVGVGFVDLHRPGCLGVPVGQQTPDNYRPAAEPARRRTVVAGAIGNVLEWYDFAIYRRDHRTAVLSESERGRFPDRRLRRVCGRLPSYG